MPGVLPANFMHENMIDYTDQESIMPQRTIESDYWTRPSIQPLSWDAKAFYLYLITNEHVNSAGVYHLTVKTICFDTDLTEKKVPELFKELDDKVKWYPEKDIVWVKKFIYRQSKSPKFIQAVSKHLTNLNLNGIASEVIDYNIQNYGLTIPYPYRTYGVSITNDELTKPEATEPLADEQSKEFGIVCTLYEQNIGIISPMMRDRLLDVIKEYPAGWFELAVKEAVNYNKRNMAYIERILQNWSTSGVKSGLKPEGSKGTSRKTVWKDITEDDGESASND
jgi:DnaD/phage-associated family protein